MKSITAKVAVALCLLAVAGAASAAASAAPAKSGSTPFTFPVNVASADQGTFTGTFKVERFAVANGAPVASGALVGTRIDQAGVATAVYRTVTIPVDLSGSARGARGIDCDILHLELGPLDLDLLGLVVHLNKVVLDIDAEPGSGNLLGNLLCAIVGLLDGSNLNLLAELLNQLLGLLG
jgi:hypothetical protein